MDRAGRYPVDDDQVMTVAEFASLARVTDQTVYRWIREGVPSPTGPIRLAVVRSPNTRVVGRDVHVFTDAIALAFDGGNVRSAIAAKAGGSGWSGDGRRRRSMPPLSAGPLERTPKALIGTYPVDEPGGRASGLGQVDDRGDVASA